MGYMVQMSRDRFERLVEDALDEIPDDIAAQIVNVAILVEDEPPDDEPDDLLGLYDGVALTERDGWAEYGQLPDRIFVFRNPILDICDTQEDVVREVRITVLHEIGHYFGLDETRIHELGWG